MGLDVFRDGGWTVRLHLQRFLILSLCLFSGAAFGGFDHSHTGSFQYPTAEAACANRIPSAATYDITFKDTWEHGNKWSCVARTGSGAYAGGRTIYEKVEACPTPWAHQPDPITGEAPSSGECSCVDGWADAGEGFEPRCVVDRDQEANECYENGQIYDPNLGYCVLDCPNGQLNGVCLQDTAQNNDSCDASSPDYQGFIGNGSSKINLCSSQTQCPGGSFGVVNGNPTCIPDEYGPPSCSSSGVIAMDEYGYVCETPKDQPEEPPEPPEAPNTDTDGDGEPDEYRRENDPNSTDKAIDELGEGIGETNDELNKANQQLDKLGKGMSELNKSLDLGLGTANDHLKDIKDGLSSPDGGYGTSGFDLVPTFTESATDFKNAILNTEVAQSLSGFTNLPSVTSCPVYTLPETPFTGQIAMNLHCQVFEDYRGVFSVLFMFFWTGTALFLFFRA